VLVPADLRSWITAANRALKHDSTLSRMKISQWARAYDLLPPPDEISEEEFDELDAFRQKKKDRERAA
jgi:hypothetical protein